MSGFLFSFLSGIGEVKNRTVFFQEEASGKLESLRRRRQFGRKNLRWVKKPAWEEVSREKEPPAGQKACIGGGKQGKRTSCGSKSLYKRRQVGRRSLLWSPKHIQEDTAMKKKPPEV